MQQQPAILGGNVERRAGWNRTGDAQMNKFANSTTSEPLVCTPRFLPREMWVSAARIATDVNPANHPSLEALSMIEPGFQATKERIAVVTTKYWHTNGVHLTVNFRRSLRAWARVEDLAQNWLRVDRRKTSYELNVRGFAPGVHV